MLKNYVTYASFLQRITVLSAALASTKWIKQEPWLIFLLISFHRRYGSLLFIQHWHLSDVIIMLYTKKNTAVRSRPRFFLSFWLQPLASLSRRRQLQNKFTHFYFQMHNSGHPSGPPGVSARQGCLHDGGIGGELDGFIFNAL